MSDMKTRRSKRLSKSPTPHDNESRDSINNGKKQKLEKQNSLTLGQNNGNITSTKEEENRNCFSGLSKSTTVNGYDSDSSDSSVDYMKSPQALDLNSDFFSVDFRKEGPSSDFSAIENKILSGVQQLTNTESSSEEDSKTVQQEYIHIPIFSTELLQTETAKRNVGNKSGKKCIKKTVKSKLNNSDLSSKKKFQKGSTVIKSEKRNIEKMDVSELLALGETQIDNVIKKVEPHSESEEEVSDWEEVKTDVGKEIKQENHSFPKEGVQVTVDAPDIYHKRKKKGFDMVAYVKQRMNRVKREHQVLIHKVHLLCWVAHGLHVNSVLNSEELLGLSLSLIPSQHSYPKKVDIIYLKKISEWFIKTVPIVEIGSDKSSHVSLLWSLQKQFECGKAQSQRDFVLMFVCLLRSLGLTVRLVISLQPLPLKPASNEVLEAKSRKGQQSKKLEKNKIEKKVLSPDQAKQLQRKAMSKEEAIKRLKSTETEAKMKTSCAKKPRIAEKVSIEKDKKERRSIRPRKNVENKYKEVSSSSDEEIDNRKIEVDCRNKTNGNIKMERYANDKTTSSSVKCKPQQQTTVSEGVKNKENRNIVKENQSHNTSKNITSSRKLGNLPTKLSEVNNDSASMKKIAASSTTKKISEGLVKDVKSPLPKTCMANTVSMKPGSAKETDTANSKGEKLKQKTQIKVEPQRASTSQTSEDEFIPSTKNHRAYVYDKKTEKKQNIKKCTSTSKSESDTDFEHELTNKIEQRKRNRTNKSDIDRRVLSSDSDDSSEDYKYTKNNFWAEVLVDSEDWIPINVITGEVNCIEKLRKGASKPVAYIVAWNPDLSLKDVTRRYCTHFHSVTRRQRVNEDWWKETLFPFLSSHTARDKKEDEDMQKQIQELPRPTSIGECKNHPLYVLERHLLKFQAIYPPNAPILGSVRNEPLYARECVHTLHTREIWLKEAKVVRPGEQPYKIVKARPKWDRMSGKVITDQTVEIFGPWQVDDYDPPTATDGKVPRNAYGNVELFRPSMLPKGTIHLQVPGLNRVAKKLQIDCAPAVVGFDFHCGSSHPMFDGFVVCEEYQDVLLDAWNRDQEEAERREVEKREKRVYGNWRRLIKGLFIRERLKIKYGFGEEEASTSKGKKGKKSKLLPKKAKDEEEDTE